MAQAQRKRLVRGLATFIDGFDTADSGETEGQMMVALEFAEAWTVQSAAEFSRGADCRTRGLDP